MDLFSFAKAPQLLTKKDYEMLLENTHNRLYKLALMIGVNSGIQAEELLNLRASDFELELGELNVVRRDGSRRISLPTEVLRYMSENKHIFFNGSTKDAFLIPVSKVTLDKYMAYCGSIVKKKVTWWSIRHSYVKMSADSGKPAIEVANNIGTSVESVSHYFGEVHD